MPEPIAPPSTQPTLTAQRAQASAAERADLSRSPSPAPSMAPQASSAPPQERSRWATSLEMLSQHARRGLWRVDATRQHVQRAFILATEGIAGGSRPDLEATTAARLQAERDTMQHRFTGWVPPPMPGEAQREQAAHQAQARREPLLRRLQTSLLHPISYVGAALGIGGRMELADDEEVLDGIHPLTGLSVLGTSVSADAGGEGRRRLRRRAMWSLLAKQRAHRPYKH